MMDEPNGLQVALQLWHLIIGALVLMSAWIGYDRHFLQPIRKWRAEMNIWRATTDKDLERGNDKFDLILDEVRTLRLEMKAHESQQNERYTKSQERMAVIETLLKEIKQK